MGETLAQKIIRAHLLHGDMTPGSEIALRIDQTLTQDATGTMAYLEFETMGIPRVKTELSVAYVDHNTLQSGFENADDHRYLQTVAKKHGVWFSRPGNGICHQVQLERFGKPGKTLIGSDSHTPTGGGIGMLAFGAGGMDVAVAMGGGAYYITMPKMFKVNLTGTLRPYVTAKDISLELLRILSVKGGVGAIIEWGGPGIAALSVPERATITNMGTELGATTSIFPSDDVTRAFLAAEGREADFIPLASDPDARFDRIIDIDLNTLQPMIACPHSPDNVVPVETLAGTKVDQVCIGSCTNSSLFDMLKVAALLKGRTIAPGVSLSISPGSKQVLTMLADCGALTDILASGARLLECACGPCIGMGFSPNSGGVSLRTFNRNFLGRSGTKDAQVYLVSPETAVAAALTGTITDPQTLGPMPAVTLPEQFRIDDSAVLPPAPADEAPMPDVPQGRAPAPSVLDEDIPDFSADLDPAAIAAAQAADDAAEAAGKSASVEDFTRAATQLFDASAVEEAAAEKAAQKTDKKRRRKAEKPESGPVQPSIKNRSLEIIEKSERRRRRTVILGLVVLTLVLVLGGGALWLFLRCDLGARPAAKSYGTALYDTTAENYLGLSLIHISEPTRRS